MNSDHNEISISLASTSLDMMHQIVEQDGIFWWKTILINPIQELAFLLHKYFNRCWQKNNVHGLFKNNTGRK